MDQKLHRLQHLSSFALDKEQYQLTFTSCVELAKFITDSPVCQINIIDAYNQWTVAGDSLKKGMTMISREKSICQDTVRQNQTYEIKDISRNKRYKDLFYVKDNPQFRYYCGVQLTTKDGTNIGSLCVMDTSPKSITAEQKQQLQHLGTLVVQNMERESNYKRIRNDIHDLTDSFHKLNHDVRGPINGIVGIAGILIQDQQQQESTRDLTLIKKCAQTIVEKIDGVLSTVINDEQRRDEWQQPMLDGISKKIEHLYQPQAREKDVTLSISQQATNEVSLPYPLSVSLIQIVGNLVANGIKFTPSGGMVEAILALNKSDKQQMLNATVKDNGPGMSADQVAAFNNAGEIKGTRGTQGEASFGIGLQHVRQMVTQKGGTVTVESSKNDGTKFTFQLPL